MGILCQSCKQANATVHLTDIQPDGDPVERHLCENCAAQEGVTMKPHEPIDQMLEKFVKIGAGMQQAAKRQCPKCGVSFGEFRAQGLLGCPHDYTIFRELLMPLLERAHDGGTRHVGKRPGATGEVDERRTKLRRVKRELEEAVKDERYEDAARLRDELSRLEVEPADEH